MCSLIWLVVHVEEQKEYIYKGKGVPRQAEVTQGVPGRLRPRIILTFQHYKGGRSSAKGTGRLYPRRNPWYSLSEAESTSGHIVLSGVIYIPQKYLESFEMWSWRRIEKISCTDHVRNEEVLLRVNEQRSILHEIRKRKGNWIGHILRRNCLLKQVIERKIKGEMEVARRRGRRRKKLLDDLKDRRGYSYLKEEALDRTLWRHRFGGGFGPVVRQNTEWMNEMH